MLFEKVRIEFYFIVGQDEIKTQKEEIERQKKCTDGLTAILSETGDQKDEELRVIATAFHDLVQKNLELEAMVTSLKSKS